MRTINTIFCVLMLLFAVVQWNDPDPWRWITIYAVPGIWAGLSAAWPRFTKSKIPQAILTLCVAASLVGVGLYWPHVPGFWRVEVWWQGGFGMITAEAEAAREGMGMMFAALVLAITFLARGRR